MQNSDSHLHAMLIHFHIHLIYWNAIIMCAYTLYDTVYDNPNIAISASCHIYIKLYYYHFSCFSLLEMYTHVSTLHVTEDFVLF